MTEPAKPGVLDRLRARFGWFDHAMRAQERYNDSKGDFYAAGITYFTIFALFPLLMVGFAAGGFVLASQPELLEALAAKIKGAVSGDLGQQLISLMDSAIDSRTSVGIIGLATAAWAGLGWMANLREALSQMWGLQRGEPPGFVKAKLSDLAALLSAFAAIVITIALTALGNGTVMRTVLDWIGIPDFPALGVLLRIASIVVALGISWLLFTWIIAEAAKGIREPAQRGPCGTACGGRLRDLQAGGVDLPQVGGDRSGRRDVRARPRLDGVRVHHCAADPVRHLLGGDVEREHGGGTRRRAPPAEITTRVEVQEGLGVGGTIAAVAVGAVGALGLSRLRRR